MSMKHACSHHYLFIFSFLITVGAKNTAFFFFFFLLPGKKDERYELITVESVY